jgi:hypothetical protein
MNQHKILLYLKHTLRILFSAVIGYVVTERLNMVGFIRIIFFFGVYIVVSLILEIVFKLFQKEKI